MSGLEIVGPVGIRRHHLAAICEESHGHTHNYDHTTIVLSGRIRLTREKLIDGVWIAALPEEYDRGEAFEVPANYRHTIKALEPNSEWMCVFSHRDFGGLVTQRYTHGNVAAYQ